LEVVGSDHGSALGGHDGSGGVEVFLDGFPDGGEVGVVVSVISRDGVMEGSTEDELEGFVFGSE
jgi:hypothetical protein